MNSKVHVLTCTTYMGKRWKIKRFPPFYFKSFRKYGL